MSLRIDSRRLRRNPKVDFYLRVQASFRLRLCCGLIGGEQERHDGRLRTRPLFLTRHKQNKKVGIWNSHEDWKANVHELRRGL
jgi:hypothetical protein